MAAASSRTLPRSATATARRRSASATPRCVLNGSFDAPNGCINASGTDITINGSLVGNEVQIGVGGTSSINAAGGGGAGYWMYQ